MLQTSTASIPSYVHETCDPTRTCRWQLRAMSPSLSHLFSLRLFTDMPGTMKVSETLFIFLSAVSLNLRLARRYLLSLPTLSSRTISGTLYRSQNSPSGNNKQLTLNFNQSEKQRQWTHGYLLSLEFLFPSDPWNVALIFRIREMLMTYFLSDSSSSRATVCLLALKTNQREFLSTIPSQNSIKS